VELLDMLNLIRHDFDGMGGMKVLVCPICLHCSKPITDPRSGVIIEGNIYGAQLDKDGKPTGAGIVGDNFPESTPDPTSGPHAESSEVPAGMISRKAVGKTAFHLACLVAYLTSTLKLNDEVPL
jgi:hypothetical protein